MQQFLRNLEYRLRFACYARRQGWPPGDVRDRRYVDKPLILISEIQRSGGTLLSQLLDGHGEIFAYPSEIEIGYPLKWDWFTHLTSAKDPFLFEKLCDRLIVKMARYDAYKKGPLTGPFKEKKFDFRFNLNRYRMLLKNELEELGGRLDKRKIYNACMTAFFNAWENYHHRDAAHWDAKRFVSGFVPRLVMNEKAVEDFLATCPDGKILTLIRGPASWYASARAHGYEDAEGALDLWAQSAEASMALAERRPDACKQLFFDDLVLDNRAVMEDVARFCGIRWEDMLTRPTFNGFDIPSNSRFESKMGVDTSVVDRWRKVLSADEAAWIEKYLSANTAFDINGRRRDP